MRLPITINTITPMLPALPQAQAPRPRYLAPAITLLLAATLTSCVILKANRIRSGADTAQMPGVAYALPKGKVTIKVLEVPGTPDTPPNEALGTKAVAGTPATYQITYVSTDYVPDAAQSYVLKYKNNVMFEENVQVKLTKKGLLDLVKIESEDKTVEIVKKLIEIAKNIRSIAQSAQATTIYQASFDPLNPPELWQINQQLRQVRGGPYSVSIIEHPESAKGSLAAQPYLSPTEDDRIYGIAYRPVLAYGLTLSHKAIPQEVQTVLLPQGAEVVYLPVHRHAFIKKVNTMDFDEGILVEATFNKPSEALGFVEIPLEITKAIASLPGEVAGKNVASYKNAANPPPVPVPNQKVDLNADEVSGAKNIPSSDAVDQKLREDLKKAQGGTTTQGGGPDSALLPLPQK